MYNELLELQKHEEKLKDIDAGSLSNLSYMNAVIDGTFTYNNVFFVNITICKL